MTGAEREGDRMQPKVFSLRELVNLDVRWNVPPYQRHYAWGSDPKKDELVTVFWDDVREKALEDVADSIPNYFGAIICKTRDDSVYGETFEIVDGQQRITTIFLFLIALREVARNIGLHRFDGEVHRYLFLGRGDGSAKLYSSRGDKKIFPELAKCSLRQVRGGALAEHFERSSGDVKGSSGELQKKRLLVAYTYLIREVERFVLEQAGAPESADFRKKAEDTIQILLDGFLNGFEIIVINLRRGNDEQGIFHALNGKNLALSNFDLIRNGVFLRARDENKDLGKFLEQEWDMMDDDYWIVPPKGKTVPLGDSLIYHMLVAERAKIINAKRVSAEYKNYVRERRFASVSDEVRVMREHANTYREILKFAEEPVGPSTEAGIARAASMLSNFGTLALSPVLLCASSRVNDADRLESLYGLVGSYVARRAVCRLPTTNYNGIAPRLVEATRNWEAEVSFDRSPLASLMRLLPESGPDSGMAGLSRMPTDGEVRRFCMNREMYKEGKSGVMEAPSQRKRKNASLYYLLAEIERHLRSRFNNTNPVSDNLAIELLMPMNWSENDHWTFPNGSIARSREEEDRRKELILSLGNLTLSEKTLTGVSWRDRQIELEDHSTLDLNNYFRGRMKWDEDDIQERGEYMAGIICRIWPWDSLFAEGAGDGGGGAEPEGTGEGEGGAGE